MFEILLKFLRTGKLPEDLSSCQLKELATEADFFQLSKLPNAIKCFSSSLDTFENSNFFQFRILNIFGKNGLTSSNGDNKLRYQPENIIVAKRSWFGNIPVYVIVDLLEFLSLQPLHSQCSNYPPPSLQLRDINKFDESCKMNDYVVDRDGNICIYADRPDTVIFIISSLVSYVNTKQLGDKSKAFVYLRDYYYTDKKEDIEITINNQKFQCKLLALQFMRVSDVIGHNGKLKTNFRIITESRISSDADLIKSILRRLEKGQDTVNLSVI